LVGWNKLLVCLRETIKWCRARACERERESKWYNETVINWDYHEMWEEKGLPILSFRGLTRRVRLTTFPSHISCYSHLQPSHYVITYKNNEYIWHRREFLLWWSKKSTCDLLIAWSTLFPLSVLNGGHSGYIGRKNLSEMGIYRGYFQKLDIKIGL